MRFLVFMLLFLIPAGVHAQPSTRAVTLESTRNTRDLGGLPVKGGHVRPGLLYRSGALCFLTAGDVERVNGLQLKTLVELRLPTEIARDGPDRAAVLGLRVALPMGNSGGRGQDAYRSYIRESSGVIQAFFRLLSQQDSYPVMFHCSAGKDRTGILACLLLWSLGAERTVIESDYLQSQRNSPGLVVKPEWLDEVFAYVDECGGIDSFLGQCQVTPEEMRRIRRILLEK